MLLEVALEPNCPVCGVFSWHPRHCDGVKSIIDHELGRQLDDVLGVRKDAAIRALYESSGQVEAIREGLSHYGATKIDEMIADGWAEYRNSPDQRPLARQIGETIERLYKDQHPG